ncbi:SDR family NAD(P)-dependent oxidoreductase [Methylocapsa sp. S129]|uniref:SDR family NAD(P)-dependent oxidoreductase n=1 Tax=Methylocapsa sp. S129 TaxID=1641869 RepID=UPI00131ADC00|nr:glucose 1-dehydrogenase [Methylocapsa sp. S129]
MGALNGKVAIVTGGTSGIGERIVELFVEEGAKVVVAARRDAEGQALEKRLGVRFIRTDMSSEADVKAMVEAALQSFGRVDCLINNAAVPAPITGVAEMEAATIDQILAVNVRGVMLAVKHAAPVMLSQESGSIVNIASVAAHRGGMSGHIYTASKGAVLAFTRSAAAELGEKGIRVNSISPGAIVTGIFGKLAGVEASKADKVTDLVKERFATVQPIPRAGATDDIARAAVYLASDGSSFVNGQDLIIDGGMTSVTRGWSTMVAGRAEMSNRIKAAAASL